MNWRNNRSMFEAWLAHDRVGIVTDMDGTVSPIVPVPDDARITPENAKLLKALNQHLSLVAVVSGRAVQDVAAKVGLPELVYMGNHGMERLDDGQVIVAPEIAAFRPNLESAIADLQAHLVDGLWIEDKQTTLSIHYRNTQNPVEFALAFKPIVEQIAQQNGLQAFAGRMIFEIRPAVKVNKGEAFKYLIDTYRLDAALYIGDDTTDVDAFKMAKALREAGDCVAYAVGVDSDDMPAPVAENADVMTQGVSDVEAFFSWLLSALSASST